jgi:multiple sugar transport system substrate-binding protein
MKFDQSMRTLLGSIGVVAALVVGTAAQAVTQLRIDAFPDYDSHLKVVLPELTAANKELDVKFITNNHEDHHKKLTNNLATGSGAGDVVLVDVGQLGTFINSGGFIDLGSYVTAGKLEESFAPYSWSQGKGADGKQYAIPVDIGPGVLYYRRDYVEDLGYKIEDITKDWDSYLNYGVDIKKKKGVALLATAADIADLIVNATVKEGEGLYFDKDGKSLLTSERFVTALTIAKKAKDLGLDHNVTSWTNEWYELLRSGKVATQLSGAWLLGHLKNWIAPKSVGLWGVSNLPNGIYGSWGGSFLAIPKQSKNPEAAWKVIDFLVKPETQLKGLSNIGAFPANTKTYADKLFEEPVEYLKGQKARVLFADVAKKVRAVKPSRGDQIAFTIYKNALEEVIVQGKAIKATLEQADQLLTRRMRSIP